MQFRFMWGQKQSAMIAEAMILNFSEYNNKFSITKGIDDVIREHNRGFSFIYFSDECIQNGYKNGEDYLNSKKRAHIYNLIARAQIDFYKLSKKLNSNELNKASKNELAKLLSEYRDSIIFLQKLFRASDPSSTAIIERKIKDILDKFYDDSIGAFTIISTPIKLDRTQLELIDWYRILIKKKVADHVLLKHAFKYPANFANTWSYEEVIGYLRKRLKESNLLELRSEIQNIKKSKKALKKQQDEIYKRLKNKQLRVYAKILQHLAITRFDLKHAWSGAEFICLPFLKNLARCVNLEFEKFVYSYNFTDLLNYLENGVILTDNEIADRLEYTIIHYKNKKLNYLYSKKAREYFNKKHYINQSLNSLKGMIANKGKITGKVRIISVDNLSRFLNDSETFREGEVLVTTMTSPAMVSIARKAAAIVTNEGGVCSHAAIIARELKIPCIVGTHYATTVFKDGDMVEVDADCGIIKKM